mgnify:FL=1
MFFFDEIIELRHEHMCNQIMDLAMEQLLEESGKSRREAQETAVFCQVDNMMYSALPRAEFLYTQQIGRGGTMCDYTFRKR